MLPVDLDVLEAKFFKTEEYNTWIGPLVADLRAARIDVTAARRAVSPSRREPAVVGAIGRGPRRPQPATITTASAAARTRAPTRPLRAARRRRAQPPRGGAPST